MSVLGSLLTLIALGVLAFAIYYRVMLRVLHIELRAREIHTIRTPDGWRIRLFRYRKGGTDGQPVLLVHGYTANHWNLALPQGESLADYLAEKGYDCWAVDLRGSRTSLPPPGLKQHRATYDGYVMEDLPTAVGFIRQSTGYDQVHWVGHSMGGMLLYAYELAHGRQHLASGTTIGSPPWLESRWSKHEDRLVWLMELWPWGFEVVKRALTPIYARTKVKTNMVPINWDNLNPKFGPAIFFNVTDQIAGPVTRTFEDCAKHRYLAVNNDKVNVLQGLSRLEAPLLVMACPIDPIAPPANVRAFFDRLPTQDKRYIELSKAAGCEMDHAHVDPPFAKNAIAEVFAPIEQWIAAHPARKSKPGAAMAAAPAPVTETAKPAPRAEVVVTPVAAREESTSWGKALQSAADILSGLDSGNGAHEAEPAAATFTRGARKPATKARAAKSKTKRKVTTKAKKTVAAKVGKAPKPAKPGKSPIMEDEPRAGGAAPKHKASTKAKARGKRTAKDE